MGLKQIVIRNWEEVRGHAKWDLAKTIAALVFAGLTASGFWVLAKVTQLTHALTVGQQTTLLLIVVISWVISFAALTWASAVKASMADIRKAIATATKVAQALEARSAPAELVQKTHVMPSSIPQPPSALAQVIRGNASPDYVRTAIDAWVAQVPVSKRENGDVDLRIEIQEVLFRQGVEYLTMPKDMIFFRLTVTNHGHDEPTAKSWSLTVRIGKQKRDTDATIRLTPNLVVRRKGQFRTTTDEALSPDLVTVTQTDEFKRGKQKIGWVAFEMSADHNAVPPYHADFAITVTDSFGNTHVGIHESMRYIQSGEVVTL